VNVCSLVERGLAVSPRFLLSAPRALALTALCLVTSLSSTSMADADPYVEGLVAEAHAKKLAETLAWHRLGHWRKGVFGGYESEADGKKLFLDKEGRTDPDAELTATLRGFFSTDTPADPNDHAICRFPARFLYLDGALSFDHARLPARACPRFAEFWKQLAPRGVTIVFSSYYLNNPSSAFGHTFLRFDKAPESADDERRDLLDYGIDYSATVDTGNPVIYAFKGLFGLFPGTFRMLPYYYKVREYGDFESRDLWEYRLDLSPLEVKMAAAHVWELGATYFDYYYLTENCSYHVLSVLEAAAPRLELLRHVRAPVVPIDTVKALYENDGLVRSLRYRPSIRSTFFGRIGKLDGSDQEIVKALAEDPAAPLPADVKPERQAILLDAAIDLVDFRFAKTLVKEHDDTPESRLKQHLLERRAELGVPSEDFTLTPTEDQIPHLSHGASRASLGFGVSDVHKGFTELRYRMALHDLADPRTGYPEFSQIEFFPVALRFTEQDHTVRFEDASLVKITSVNPMSSFDYKPSWKLRVGATTVRDDGCAECAFGTVDFGSGVAVGRRVTGILTGDLAAFGPRFSGEGSARYRGALGPTGVFRVRFTDDFISLTEAKFQWFPLQAQKTSWLATSTLRWSYHHDLAIDLTGTKTPVSAEAVLSTMLYF
jgi:hypothetical protein